jgi:predicted CoA-binding protein
VPPGGGTGGSAVRMSEAQDVLTNSQLWFIVGLGNNPDRDAYRVARVLQDIGKTIVPIYPRAEVVHGAQGFRTIDEAAAVHGPPDVVDVFVRSDRAGAFADQAIAAGAKAVWFQLGVIDEAAAQRVRDAGLTMVMDRCPVIELRANQRP